MSIDFVCSACGHHLHAGSESAGKSAKCKNCGSPVRIPLSSAPPAPSASNGPPPVPSPVLVPASAPPIPQLSASTNRMPAATQAPPPPAKNRWSHGQPSPLRDIRPILPRCETGVWSKIRASRDQIFEAFQQSCQAAAVEAKVLRSDEFVHPAWVKFECWIPQQEPLLTERAMVLVTFEPKPFHRYEIEYQVEIDNRGCKKKYASLLALDHAIAAGIVGHLLQGSPLPPLKSWCARQFVWQFWRRGNKVDAIKQDLALVGTTMLMVAGIATAMFVIGVVLIGLAALIFYFLNRRYRLVRNAGRPDAEPRSLLRVDSWQTVVAGIGDAAHELRGRFLKRISELGAQHLHHRVEHIWYWSQDGLEEREQIMLKLNRGIVFCQIYQYDQDLYVGWDGHLNLGIWMEKAIASGIDRQTGRLVQINSVEQGYQRVTEYDITDLSCLMERTHAKLTALVKELMEERKIDQEVDFQIVRGERQDLTKDHSEKSEKSKGGLLSRLKRIG